MKKHLCHEWDLMEIEPGDPEMEACTCKFKLSATLPWLSFETAPKDGTKIIVFYYSQLSDWCKHLYPHGIENVEIIWWDGVCWQNGRKEIYEDFVWVPFPK